MQYQGQWHLGNGDTQHGHVGTEKEAKVKESTWRLNTVSIPWGQPEMIERTGIGFTEV